ncbi:hypothetical protein SODALDRAFT_268878 [Sodiomyces alkalinus F11]|uniref:DUF4048 domain-containing protein n=1 Tax=Sodiomyces alkalinus (strain CBS 110278 / VKM F-3762 / F11) TaxID=1314773 RepID=A0A3N2Q8H4_SODAK|nr:hypothetical protein SODALDRAFT_268878 [Sodiomyces alkalinus F11]ROT43074.1 hypothetical protein SODALDRAFT_268878 [Sodiomyces alkalinus F11]
MSHPEIVSSLERPPGHESKPTPVTTETTTTAESDVGSMSMPPPAAPTEDNGRSSRSTSNASRSSHRLSLTLPIAPPTSDPSRPSSTVLSSFPATPVDSGLTSPVDNNDLIIAIAAQERKVLELREELGRAEEELSKLKRQWTMRESYQKRGSSRPLAPFVDGAKNDDFAAARRSVELDRRRVLLQSQNTSKDHRRKVLRGGHARTLSLLSPTKTDGGFPLHEDLDGSRSPDLTASDRGPANPVLQKRASWQPRNYNPNQQGVKQIAEDFKLGLWSFMEDIRQATVGDEPITGQLNRSPNLSDASVRKPRPWSYAADQETIKASGASRPKASLNSAFDQPEGPTTESATRPATSQAQTQARPFPKPMNKSKRFSWTPLPVDSIDDDAWSNWESPSASSIKSTRWSGSTVSGSEGITPVPEDNDVQTPLKKKSSRASITIDGRTEQSGRQVLSPTKLEELLPGVVNRLSPSNIKRTATSLMDEWERSLTPPRKENNNLIDLKENQV